MKTGLVLEGGGCRGIFTSGVVDYFQEQGLRFSYCIGVSAGAGNAMNYKSCQPGRAAALTAGDQGPAYYGLSQVKKSGKLLNLDLVYGDMSFGPPWPFDFERYAADPMQCEYVVTDCRTGQALYLEGGEPHRLVDVVKASSSLPGICSPVNVDGTPCLDGGIADPMPVHRALAQGCQRVVLVTTKPADDLHLTDYTRLRHLMARLYRRRYPAFFDALMTRLPRYFDQLSQIEELERSGQVLVIRPRVCRIHSLEKDREKMREYYHHGEQVARESWERLLAYLEK